MEFFWEEIFVGINKSVGFLLKSYNLQDMYTYMESYTEHIMDWALSISFRFW